MGTWGSELWDRHSCVLSHVTRGGEELSSVFARFVKERGDLEKEYAKSVRKLVIKYQQKTENKQDKETTQAKGFRLVLQEMICQAGQHDIIAETFTMKLQQEVQNKAKEVNKKTKTNLKEVKRISDNMSKMHKDLEKAKTKYQKSFVDWESAKNNHSRADKDVTISRNEIVKLRTLSNSRRSHCEDCKGVYARQLIKTNKYQAEYYCKELPGVLNSLQNIEIDRIDFLKDVMEQSVAAEKHVAPTIAKCRQDMESIIQNINSEADSDLVVERLKTCEVPPQDIPFEEMTCGTEIKFGTLKRMKSKLKMNKSEEKENNFSPQKDLEEIPYSTTPPTIRKIENSPGGNRSNSLQSGSMGFGTLSNYSSNDRDSDFSDNSELKTGVHEDIITDEIDTVVALYAYVGDCIESSIDMEVGEEFLVTEGDEGGWTKVRRKNSNSEEYEGYVPTAYLQRL